LFRGAGYDGVVWHPRFYPNEPPYLGERYLAELSDVILHAQSLGLAFWLYDEDGWPSGTVGGQLLKKYPADAQRWAELAAEKPERCLAEFEHGGKKWFLAERTGAGVDYFNPDLARHFLELTHERYRTGLKPEAWSHVAAIFSDEPEFGLGHAYDSLSKHGAIPWTPKLPQLFHQRHGEDLLPLIPDLFFNGDGRARHSVRAVVATTGASSNSRRAEDCPPYQLLRVKFWELLTDLFNESFTAPISQWCEQHGKLFTAHVKGEEHPLFQVPTNGSCHQFFRRFSLPAIDALERYPANNFYPRQVSSAARQFGSGRCMVEAFGGAGWGATPEDLERYLLWLGRNGLTDFVMHLSQYRLDSAAMHDWPPSQPLHLTWREAYPEVLRRVRSALQKNPRPVADTLVIAPNRGIMANYQPQEFLQTNVHNAATYPDSVAGKINRHFLEEIETLHASGVNYDVADERTVEQFGQRNGATLALGNSRYRRVIAGHGCKLNEAACALVASLAVGAPASDPARIETNPNPAGSETGVPIPVAWSLEKHPMNLLLLECVRDDAGWFAARFARSAPLLNAKLELVFVDDLAAVELNGHKLLPKRCDDGAIIMVDETLFQAVNTLRFRLVKSSVQRPFVWLRGRFRVMSRTPFVAGPNRTIKTDGGFVLHPACETIQPDLVADGFPFLREPVMFTGTITLPNTVAACKLDGVEADAIRLRAGELDFGWTWRTNGEVRFDVKLAAGTHRLRLELVPNTFNAFGPHHYYLGDWHVVSPDQIKGVRNFADPLNAPACTHVKAWHFRRFNLPETITTFA
jgi:hypothetical protein